jgi:hypothetical protein
LARGTTFAVVATHLGRKRYMANEARPTAWNPSDRAAWDRAGDARSEVRAALGVVLASPRAMKNGGVHEGDNPERDAARRSLLKLRDLLTWDTLEHGDASWQAHRLTWDDCSPLEPETIRTWIERWS